MKYLLIVLFLGFGYAVNAQDVNFNGVPYEIKKDKIFKAGVDVTETLSVEDRTGIRDAFDKKMTQIKNQEETKKRLENAEKAEKKAEEAQKKAEKEQKALEKERKAIEKKEKAAEKKKKQAEKALKKSEKAQSNYEKAVDKQKDAVAKYEKLKGKGKLSPVDEAKMLEKIEKYKESAEKAKRKL